jgi:UDP-N-acetylmuramoyl-tripeptide--D-alanyl-D-alanine ligase
MAFAKQLSRRYRYVHVIRTFVAWILLIYLKIWANIALLFFNGTVIGIAGAVGKSTTRNALYTILSPHKPTYMVDGNSETGIPLGILGLSSGFYKPVDWLKNIFLAPFHIANIRRYTYLIVEMGIDGPKAPKNMKYLLSICRPHIGILLSESPAHVEQYESLLPQSIKHKTPAEQLSWFSHHQLEDDASMLMTDVITTTIVDASDTKVYDYTKKHISQNLYTVGLGNEHDIYIHHNEVTTEGTHFGFSIHTHQIKEYMTLFFPNIALPKTSGASIGCALLTAIHIGIPLEEIKQSLEQSFTIPPGRGTLLHGKKDTIIIDSSYNASPASVISFIHLLSDNKKTWKRPIVCIMGDMKELGSYTEFSHREVAKELVGVVDYVLLVGPFTKQCMLPYIEAHKDKFKSVISLESITQLHDYTNHIPKEAVILVKGSQTLEEGIKILLKNSKDVNKLCRQDEFWKENKQIKQVWMEP